MNLFNNTLFASVFASRISDYYTRLLDKSLVFPSFSRTL